MLAIILMVAMVSCKKDSASDNNGGNSGGGTNGHEYVDLGLPSGNLWATVDLKIGDEYSLFAWGETELKDDYSQSNYKYYVGTVSDSVESCIPQNHPAYHSPYLHYNRTVYSKYNDNLNISYEHPILDASDDAATVNWGNGWRIPTRFDWGELYLNCIITPVTSGQHRGILFTSLSNNNTLLLPTGSYWINSVEENIHQWQWDMDEYCYLYTDYNTYSQEVTINSYYNTADFYFIEKPRYEGAKIRPVFSNH